MIDRSMLRLPWSPVQGKLNQTETLGLTLLARYNAGAIPARVATSFRRAFAMDFLERHPVVPGGRPGYVVSIWNGDGMKRITVAIEGMRTPSQLWAGWAGFNSVLVAGSPGRVFHAFDTYADTIRAELLNSSDFTAAFNSPNVGVCFAGFSLGAAVAEVLAVKFRAASPQRQYQLSKWGACRTGNGAWVNGNQFPSDRGNFYCVNDPVFHYPYMTMHQLNVREALWSQGWTNFAVPTPSQVFYMSGEAAPNLVEDRLISHLRSQIDTQRAITPENPWYYHRAEAYRLMMFNSCELGHAATALEAHYRFRFLEYDDDNNWWGNYTTGQITYEGLTQLLGSPPADTAVSPEPEADLRREQRAAQHTLRQVPVADAQDNFNMQPLPRGAWMPRRVRDF